MKKFCKRCNGVFIYYSSTDTKQCADCKTVYRWCLDDGQESVLIEGKVGGLNVKSIQLQHSKDRVS